MQIRQSIRASKWTVMFNNPTTFRHRQTLPHGGRFNGRSRSDWSPRKVQFLHNIARNVFDEIPSRSVSVYNRMLNFFCWHKQYKETLNRFSHLLSSEKPDFYTIHIALKACVGLKALDFGKAIHGLSKKSGLIGGHFVGSALVEMYAKCGEMDESLLVFEEYSDPDAVLWTTVITGFEKNGRSMEALEFFARMAMAKGGLIDSVTLVSVVSACAQSLNLKVGRSVHGYMIMFGLQSSLFLSNALLNLYGKTGSVYAAKKLFERMEEKDVISWGCMISCYAHNGRAVEALDLFNEMVARGIQPNVVALISALQACEATCNLAEGQKVHELCARNGLDSNNIGVSKALIDMYMSCSSPDEAFEVFERMSEKDAVSFSSMLQGCVRNGRMYESIGFLCDMMANDFQPYAFDVIKILTACSELGVLRHTSCIHGFITKCGLGYHSFMGPSLIESYAKCGSLDGAIAMFGQIKHRDVVVWSSMLAAYGFHGKGCEALDLFKHMINDSAVTPNEVTFLSILSACSHAGLINEGVEIFNMMVKDYKVLPNSKHYGIVVDLLGRVGELEKAMEFINGIPGSVDANIWGALLGSCRIHQNAEMAKIAAKKMAELDALCDGHHVLLSNVYAFEEKWDEVAEVRHVVEEKQSKKASGKSMVET